MEMQMQMQQEPKEHSPLPWAWLPDEGQFVVDAARNIVAEVPCQGCNPVDGAFIVRAVNNHDALVTNLRQMLNVFYPHACLPGAVCARCEVLVRAQRALSAAQEQSNEDLT